MRRGLASVVTVLVALSTACSGGGDERSTGRLEVEAAFYPLEFLVASIGGPDVEVTGLTKPGAEPHDVELSPRQVASLGDADLVVLLSGFQPAVDDAAGQGDAPVLDVAEVQPLVASDPHVWLDPKRLAAVAEAVTDRLVALKPTSEQGLRARAATLTGQLTALDEELRTGLSDCTRKDLVTSHSAFGYLARAYGLEQVGITGLSPEAEPSPGRLAEVARYAKAHGVTTIFFEELVSPKTAQALAREVGAKAAVLNPLESPPESGDYLSAMRANLAALRTALGCR